jgi:hypothetical protein
MIRDLHEKQESVLVFSMAAKDKRVVRENPATLTKKELAVVEGYKTKLYRIAYNKNPAYRHVGHVCNELDRWYRLFYTGWPWKGNEKMCRLATPILAGYAETLSKRLRELYKAQHGRDIGKIDL